MLLLSVYHMFPIRNGTHAIFQAPEAFTSWQRSDWDAEAEIIWGVSGGNFVFISLSIIITHAGLQTWICRDTTQSFFSAFFLPVLNLSFLLPRYILCLCIRQYKFLCLFTLHNQCERRQGRCNYSHYYHKNNFYVYSHTRRTHLIESISFADDGFTSCHGGCCLISMLWKYSVIL